MFNHIHVNIDSVEFEYVTKGNLENISIARPDGIGYSQWSGVWNAFVEFLESRQRQVDTSEIEALEDEIYDLRKEIGDKNSLIESLEEENYKLSRALGYEE